MSVETIAETVWAYATRTLDEGSPGEPATRLDYICEAVWEYESRTLTGAPPGGAEHRPKIMMHYRRLRVA